MKRFTLPLDERNIQHVGRHKHQSPTAQHFENWPQETLKKTLDRQIKNC